MADDLLTENKDQQIDGERDVIDRLKVGEVSQQSLKQGVGVLDLIDNVSNCVRGSDGVRFVHDWRGLIDRDQPYPAHVHDGILRLV